jgi:hypothetical protein
MNANNRPSNNAAFPVNASSYIAAPINSVKNIATNVANNISNTVKNVINNNSGKNNAGQIFSIPILIAVTILIVLFIIAVIFREKIALGFEKIWKDITRLFNKEPEAVQPPPPEFVPEAQFINQGAVEKILPGKKEVFNISDNKYSYSDAEPLCKAFGAELATYDQVKDAWQNGADWCNYGWVKGQAAVYPTQEETFNKLQAGPEDQRLACGVPGVNGGYFDNPELKFGVNCYGNKPSENEADARAIMAQNGDLTPEALKYDRKVLDYKTQMGQIPVNPFSPGKWSS